VGCWSFLGVDVVFGGGCCVFVLVFLYGMAWTCIGNLMPWEKGTTMKGKRELRRRRFRQTRKYLQEIFKVIQATSRNCKY